MSLFELLACPRCKVALDRAADRLTCVQCTQVYPIIDGVPVLLLNGALPSSQDESEPPLRTSYNPWIHRLLLQSLPPGRPVLDLGSGNMALDLPHVIRLDRQLGPHVDLVADAHALPFLPGRFDAVIALAVFEHLAQPFRAAAEIATVLRPGGYFYGEANFLFPYDGANHHYFGMTQHGISEVFAAFRALRVGVAPYQMPSFALEAVLRDYNDLLLSSGVDPRDETSLLINDLLHQQLRRHDVRLNEAQSLRLAAGVFFFGTKDCGPENEVIPATIMQAWQHSPTLQTRYPDPYDLGVADNLMQWAKQHGQHANRAIATALAAPLFYKRSEPFLSTREHFDALPLFDTSFGAIDAEAPPTQSRAQALSVTGEAYRRGLHAQYEELQAALVAQEQALIAKNRHIAQLEGLIRQIEAGRVLRLLNWITRRSSEPVAPAAPAPPPAPALPMPSATPATLPPPPPPVPSAPAPAVLAAAPQTANAVPSGPPPPSFRWREPGFALLRGHGIEIGAFENPARLPPDCTIEYVDAITPEEAQRLFPEISTEHFVAIDHIVDLNLEGLGKFADRQFDFVIINHVIEHLVNPISIIEETLRVLKPGGRLVLSIPDRDFTFDRKRPTTSFDHLRQDYEQRVTHATPEDYMDIPRYVFPQFLEPPEVLAEHLQGCMNRREHLHVWTSESFRAFLDQAFALIGQSPTWLYEVRSDVTAFEYFAVLQKS